MKNRRYLYSFTITALIYALFIYGVYNLNLKKIEKPKEIKIVKISLIASKQILPKNTPPPIIKKISTPIPLIKKQKKEPKEKIKSKILHKPKHQKMVKTKKKRAKTRKKKGLKKAIRVAKAKIKKVIKRKIKRKKVTKRDKTKIKRGKRGIKLAKNIKRAKKAKNRSSKRNSKKIISYTPQPKVVKSTQPLEYIEEYISPPIQPNITPQTPPILNTTPTTLISSTTNTNRTAKSKKNSSNTQNRYYSKKSIKSVSNSNSPNLTKAKRAFLKNIRDTINSNKIYPKRAKRMGIEGKVRVIFDIDKSGNVLNIRTSNAPNILKKAVIRAIRKSFPVAIPQKLQSLFPLKDISVNIFFKLRD